MKDLPVRAGSFTKLTIRERESLKTFGKEDREYCVAGLRWKEGDAREAS